MRLQLRKKRSPKTLERLAEMLLPPRLHILRLFNWFISFSSSGVSYFQVKLSYCHRSFVTQYNTQSYTSTSCANCFRASNAKQTNAVSIIKLFYLTNGEDKTKNRWGPRTKEIINTKVKAIKFATYILRYT